MSAWRRRCWSQQTASQRWSQDNLGAKTLMYMSHVCGARRCCMYFSFAWKACFEIFSCETLGPQRPVQQWAGNAACFFETTRHTPLAKHMWHIVEMAHQIRPKFSFCCECCSNIWILETQAICLPVYIVYRSRLSPTSGSTRTCLIWRGIVKDAASPLHELAILPNALPLEAFGCLRDCISVLLPVLPLAAVGSSIWPSQCPFAMFPAIHKLANIGTAIRPPHLALGRHGIVGPLAWIAAPIAPCVHTLSMHVIVVELAFVSTQCRPNKLAPSMFCSSLELTFEDRTICPFFFAMALLHIIHPLSGVFCTGRIIVDSLPFLLVILELANIFCSILPNQYSMTVLLAIEPCAFIGRIALKDLWSPATTASISFADRGCRCASVVSRDGLGVQGGTAIAAARRLAHEWCSCGCQGKMCVSVYQGVSWLEDSWCCNVYIYIYVCYVCVYNHWCQIFRSV